MQREILIATSDVGYGLLLAHHLKALGAEASVTVKPMPAGKVYCEEPPQYDILIVDCRDGARAHATISSLAAGRIIFLHPARSDGQEKTALAGAICFSSPIDPQVFLRALDGPALRSADSGSAILSYAGIDIDLARMKVQALGTRLHLPPIQYRLLVQMMLTPEQVVTRKALMAAVWPNHRFVEGKTLNIHMGRLRSALRAASGAQPIRCVRGSGYAIELKCSART